ncbi:MAG: tetratricopeptide repeat protein [Rhizobacter sp.]|nr:tetratricopeptide repeat protein [Rhizobacter sp.]
MSLINQVLRDLDKRRAVTAAAPAAVKTSLPSAAPNALQRARRWGLGFAITAMAVVAGGVAQGSINWPGRVAELEVSMPVGVAAVAEAAPVVPPVTAAPVAVTTPAVSPEVKTETPSPGEPVLVAVAAPTVRSPLINIPRSEPKARLILVPDLAASASALALPKPEPRIDKRMASRTPQERAEAHYQRGVTAHQAGQINDSADAFMAALREDARYAPARQAQAGLLIGQSRHEEALALLHEGITLSPQQPTLALMLARLQAERQDLSAAADTLKAASGNATNNAEYQGFYAAILQRAGRHPEAAEKFSAALRLAPANSVWWMGLGISLSASDQSAAAREAFMRAKTTGALPPEAGQYVELRLRQML